MSRKHIGFLLVVLMLGTLFGVTAIAGELTQPPAGKVPSVEVKEVEQAMPVFREADDGPSLRPNHPPIDQIPPLPMPQPREIANQSKPEESASAVYHDALTGQTVVVPKEPGPASEGVQQGGGYNGADGGQGGSELVPATFYDMYQINNVGDFPWRMNCKLVMRFGSDYYKASGTMRDAEVVLTAGHCVYDYGGYGWADEIWVYPGWDGAVTGDNAETYGWGHGTHFVSLVGWTDNGDFNYDLGVIEITRAVGMLTGWYSWSYGGDCAWHTSHTYYNPSYPAECCNPPDCTLHNGLDMYYWYGLFDSCPGDQLQIDTDGGCYNAGWGGMSGSGAYYIDGDNRYVAAVCSNSNRDDIARYCEERQSFVEYTDNTFIPGARGSAFDLQALDVNAEPVTIVQGGSTTMLNHLATNPTNGNKASTQFTVRVYLSPNDLISSSDTLLSTQYGTWAMNPMSSLRVNMQQVTIPSNTPAGNYWIGVIYDPATDGDSSNNDASGWDAVPIHVIDSTAPAAITNLMATNPTTSSVQLSWTAPGDDGNSGTATSYDIRYRTGGAITDANWATATQVTGEPVPKVASSSETFMVTGLAASTTYYFAIKTADEVPNWSPISNSPNGTTTAALEKTCVRVSPATQVVAAGNSFQVNITVENVTNMAADQAMLNFDPATMQVTTIIEGEFMKTGGSTLPVTIIDNTAGTALFAYILWPSGNVSGSGVLATIEFTTNASAECTFGLNLTDVILLNASDNIPIAAIYNGTVKLDNTPPTVEIHNPANNTWFDAEPVNVTFHLWDAKAEVLNYTVFLDDIEVDKGMAASCTNTTVGFGLLSEGNHVVRVNATDDVGWEGSAEVTIHVDLTSPQVEILAPASGTWVDSEPFNISFRAWDNKADTLTYQILADSSELANGSAMNDTVTNVSIDPTVLGDCDHVLRVNVTDKAGKTNSSEVTIHVDLTPPTVEILAPANDSWVDAEPFNLSFLISDNKAATLAYTIFDGLAEIMNGTAANGSITNVTIDPTLLVDCDHLLSVTAIDSVGKMNSSEVTIHIDLTPPTVEILAPVNGTWFDSEPFNLSFLLQDNKAVTLNYLIFDGLTKIANGTATNGTVTNVSINPTVLGDCDHLLRVTATDSVGKTNSSEITIHIDLTVPTVEILAPANDSWFDSENVTVTFLPCDNKAATLNYSILVNGVEKANGMATNCMNETVNLGVLPDECANIIRINVTDTVGKMNSSEVTVWVDLTPPIVQLQLPGEGGIYGKVCVPLNFSAHDTGACPSGLNTTGSYYVLDGGAPVNISGNDTIIGLTAGEHTVFVYARDSNGNSATSNTVHFTIHPGDINGDGVVNVFDLQQLAWAFMSHSSDSNWNENADLNCDGVVNVFDLQILAWNFMKHYDTTFEDDFESGNLNNWNIISGDWDIIIEGDNHIAHLNRSSEYCRILVSKVNIPDSAIIKAKVKGDADGDAADTTVGFYSNSNGSSFYYLMLGAWDGVYLTIGKRVDNVEYELVPNKSIAPSNNIWYNVKIKLEDSNIFAKIWSEGSNEPPDWQISYLGADKFGEHIVIGTEGGQHNEEFWFDNVSVIASG